MLCFLDFPTLSFVFPVVVLCFLRFPHFCGLLWRCSFFFCSDLPPVWFPVVTPCFTGFPPCLVSCGGPVLSELPPLLWRFFFFFFLSSPFCGVMWLCCAFSLQNHCGVLWRCGIFIAFCVVCFAARFLADGTGGSRSSLPDKGARAQHSILHRTNRGAAAQGRGGRDTSGATGRGARESLDHTVSTPRSGAGDRASGEKGAFALFVDHLGPAIIPAACVQCLSNVLSWTFLSLCH